jgi:3-deoxy-D-manno-octulosonic-acid transferase
MHLVIDTRDSFITHTSSLLPILCVMILLYNLGIFFYTIFIKIAALFNPKAKLWIDGRKHIFENIASQITDNEAIIWFHAASLGEFEQGRPLIEKIKQEQPQYKILLTFFSPSGYEIRKNYPHADSIAYLPIDTKANAQRFLDLVKPKKIIFIKYEFWYHYLNEATLRGISTIYIAALFKENSSYFKWYFSFYQSVFQRITHFFVQDILSKDVLLRKVRKVRNVGRVQNPANVQQNPNVQNPNNVNYVSVVGDPRVDRVAAIAKEAKKYPLIDAFAKNQNILIAGSTWAKDELILKSLLTQYQDWKYIIAPHEIAKNRLQSIENQYNRGEVLRFSQANETNIQTAKILLIDNIGMLSSLYFYGKIAYIGGGFGTGIHNTLEPMAFGLPVIFGTKYQKFEEARTMVSLGGAFSIRNEKELNDAFDSLSQKEFYEKSKQVVLSYMFDNQGATQKIYDYLFIENIG